MIKVDPALSKGQPWGEPALIGTSAGTKINDLEDCLRADLLDQMVDQGGEQGVDGGRAS